MDPETKSASDKNLSENVPLLEPDFRSWDMAFCSCVVSLSEYNLLEDDPPAEPLSALEIAAIGNAGERRVAFATREEHVSYHRAQRKAAALLHVSVGMNKNAKNLLTRQRTELIRDPPLRQGENHPIRVMMEHLRSHYIPVNELRAIKAERAVKDVLLKRNEPLTKFLVRFEDGLNDVAAQGKIFTLIEKKAMLDSALKSGERTMDNLITSLQMQMGEMTWPEITSYLSRFDDSSLGSARLIPDKPKAAKLDTIAAIEKRDCKHCGKAGHIIDKCWKLHPDLIPKKIKERRKRAE